MPRSQAMRRIAPFLFAVPLCVVLVGLGLWQWQRAAWKTALLAHIAGAEAAAPVALADAAEPFAKVFAVGRFDYAAEALYGLELRGNTLGARLITPLLRPAAPPLLVDRGWVPLSREGVTRPAGEVTVIGYIRPAERRNVWSARDDVVGRHFFTFDPLAMAAALGVPPPLPFGLVALGEGGEGWPDPARTLPRPPNHHRGYALTWFSLAAVLAIMMAFWWRRGGEEGR